MLLKKLSFKKIVSLKKVSFKKSFFYKKLSFKKVFKKVLYFKKIIF